MNKDINFCFIYGKIITDIDFKFFYNSKLHNSIVEFEIEIDYKMSTKKLKNTFVRVIAYDENSDTLYKNYKKGKYIKMLGRVTRKGVEVDKIYER